MSKRLKLRRRKPSSTPRSASRHPFVLRPYKPTKTKEQIGAEAKEIADNNPGRTELASQGLKQRMEDRGRSFNATQFVMGLTAAAEVALFTVLLTLGLTLKLQLLAASSMPALVGFIAIMVGLAFKWKEISPNPEHCGSELLNAMGKEDQLAWVVEQSRRSEAQRTGLLVMRRWFMLSLGWIMISAIMAVVAICRIIATM
ncbi:MAG TPA: hypothetical protein VLI05_02825 [Candidatus Saccharimonadia bacterium]|nr:hypothetical protein [Candidatus Saccharimonadia bacterium]